MYQPVTFFSQGVRIAGHLHMPDDLADGERRPGIVLCHGFNAVQTVAIPDIAAHFCDAGFVVLRFDYRGLGQSEGPRGRVVPHEHVQDIRNALTFLEVQPGVASDRLGLYGTSFGGSHAVSAAAVDHRVQALVSTVSIGNGRRWMQRVRRHWEFQEFLRRLDEHRRHRVLTGITTMVSPYEVMVPDPTTQAVHAERARLAGRPAPDVDLESGEAIVEYAPEEVVERIAPRAALFIHAADDALVPPDESIAMFERAGDPKRLVLVPECGHYDVYHGAGFARVMAEATSWFDTYLRP